MVRREQEAAAAAGEARQLGALAGQADALVQRARLMLGAARDKAAATLRFLAEEVPGEPAFSQAEPRRMLADLHAFFGLLHRAHADSARMAVCLATLEAQRREEEQERATAAAAAAEAAEAEAEADASAGAEEAAAAAMADPAAAGTG